MAYAVPEGMPHRLYCWRGSTPVSRNVHTGAFAIATRFKLVVEF